MRPKRQGQRRAELAEAARAVLLERGAVGLRIKDIAEYADLAPSSVLYYYPRLDELLLEVARGAMERYTDQREQAVDAIEGAPARLRVAIHLGVPTGPDDEESRLLYEIDALTGTSSAFDLLSSSYFDRQVQVYASVLETGAARGELTLAAPARTLARGFVAMEDGLGLQVVIGHPGIDAVAAEEVLIAYGSGVTGVDLASAPLPPGYRDDPPAPPS